MTPAARIAAAIGILDAVLAGEAAEKTLTTWARKNRYAGSGDRAAIRDHVFDALRCRRSFAWLGGAETGRGLMLGALRDGGTDPQTLFTGEGYGPDRIGETEILLGPLSQAPQAVRADMPDWLMPYLQDSLGDTLDDVAQIMRRRAPLFLRVNLGKTSHEAAMAALAGEGIASEPVALSATALMVVENPRRVQASAAYRDGLVEVQDAASQAVVDSLPAGGRVLDYCAGGGGKSLGLAARGAQVTAHDIEPARMQDIPARAARAGVAIDIATGDALTGLAPFDLVLCDAPCSGSGAWRRSPEAKWRLTPERLQDLTAIQGSILDSAMRFVAPGGVLAYVTCSILRPENSGQVGLFLTRHPDWKLDHDRAFSPLEGGDGFYVAHLTRRN